MARDREQKTESTDLTKKNMDKVTRFRKDGMRAFEDMVASLRDMKFTAGAINPKEWKKLDR